MKLLKFLWAILVVVALVNGTAKALTPDITPSIGLLREQTVMKKCSIVGKEVYFTEEDFTDVIGNDFSYITVSELPDKNDGVLTLSGVNLIKGQTISAKNLSRLRFVPAEKQTVNVSSIQQTEKKDNSKQVSFTFIPSADGWENTPVKCVINVLPTLNFAPVASDMTLKTSSDVAVFCNIGAYDPDNDVMTVTIDEYPKNGTVRVDAQNNVIYTPANGFSGSDGFVYYVTDIYGNRSSRASAAVEVSDSSVSFEDMKGSALHYAAIKMADENIMTYAEKAGKFYFMPDEEVNRIDFTVMLLCASSLNQDVKWLSDTAFNDDNGLSAGRKAYLALAQSLDIITNTNGYFKPLESIKRCDAAEMVRRALKVDEKTLDTIVSDKSSERLLTRAETAEILYNIKQYTGK